MSTREVLFELLSERAALPHICTIQELAKYLNVSIWWLRRHKPPRCPGIGRTRYNTRSRAFEEWLAGVIDPDHAPAGFDDSETR
jgi:hypothetical protein